MFRTELKVVHAYKKDWELTAPLVWEGRWEYLIIRSGFITDFASIPRPVRWLLDNAGRNSEAAVLHDAVWRESQLTDARVDPWDADGMFRRALRQTGSTALARGVMWFAVRTAAMAGGRFGDKGPGLGLKVLQLLSIFVLALVSVIPTTVVAVIGLIGYWVASWVAAIVWYLYFERRKFTQAPNWPWPFNKHEAESRLPYSADQLTIIRKPDHDERARDIPGRDPNDRLAEALQELLAEKNSITNDDIDQLLAQAVHSGTGGRSSGGHDLTDERQGDGQADVPGLVVPAGHWS